MRITMLALPLVALAACAEENPTGNAGNEINVVEVPDEGLPPADSPANASEGLATDGWIGRWIGVEGTYLEISAGGEPGAYALEMQYDLDHRGTFEGRAEGDAIAFERGGETLRLTAGDGDATGLRYLVGKQDCLIVASGEGYCRD